MIARELDDRRFALVLSALAFIGVPIYLNDGSVMTTNCLEPLLWMGCVYFAIMAIKRDDPTTGSGLVSSQALVSKRNIRLPCSVLRSWLDSGLQPAVSRPQLKKWR